MQSVTSAECFAVVAQQFCQSTDITLITRKAIEKVSKKLNLEKVFGDAKPVQGISKFHCMEVDTKMRCVRFRLYSSQDTHANQLVQPSSSDDESDPDQQNEHEEVLSGELSEENGDEDEYGDGDDDVSDSDEVSDEDVDDDEDVDYDDDEEADEDEDDQDNTSHHITKPVIASGDSLHSGLPKEFVSVLNNICPHFSVLAHNNLLIEMIVNGEIPFGGNSLINGADLNALYGRGPLSSSESK